MTRLALLLTVAMAGPAGAQHINCVWEGNICVDHRPIIPWVNDVAPPPRGPHDAMSVTQAPSAAAPRPAATTTCDGHAELYTYADGTTKMTCSGEKK